MDPIISGGLIGIAIGVAIIFIVFGIATYEQKQRHKREKLEAMIKLNKDFDIVYKKHSRESHRANVKRNK